MRVPSPTPRAALASRRADPTDAARGLPAPERHELLAPDGALLRLTRYRGGARGPVLLVHGVGVWSGMFQLPTVDEHLVQFLVRHGFDTWLLDWRGSIALPLRQFTLDEAAENDLPAAVRRVREATGAPSVQVVAHCAGAVVLFMALASGLLPDVRAVVCSQVALHHRVPLSTRLKASLDLPALLEARGLEALGPGEDPEHPRFQAALGGLVDAVHHECRSTLCHRLTFLYGRLFLHERLSPATHARLDEQFGPCNLTTFRHLAQLALLGHSARFDFGRAENLRRYGRETPPSYVSAEHLRLPITFLSGARNGTYLPRSAHLTHAWLSEVHGPALYRHVVLEGYGHLDTFMGSTAHRDVYPRLLEGLAPTA
jgi:pimeloyl-ACP methyl ester carboxylesterase